MAILLQIDIWSQASFPDVDSLASHLRLCISSSLGTVSSFLCVFLLGFLFVSYSLWLGSSQGILSDKLKVFN